MMNRFNLHYSPDPPEPNGKETPPKTDDVPEDTPDWMKKRLSEISGKKTAAEDRADKAELKLKGIKDKQEKDRLAKLEEDGDFKKVNETLVEENLKLKERSERLDKVEQKIREVALAKIADKLGDEAAAGYADFETDQLQTVADTFIKTADAPNPDSDRGGSRNVDENEAAALKKYGSKPNIARLNSELYRKLWPNPRRHRG